LNHQTNTNADSRRILELELQNARLQQLVAELLIKNQQLRLKRQVVQKQLDAVEKNTTGDRRSWFAQEV
jgi:site-specific recombinase